jgi:hypothetical protein
MTAKSAIAPPSFDSRYSLSQIIYGGTCCEKADNRSKESKKPDIQGHIDKAHQTDCQRSLHNTSNSVVAFCHSASAFTIGREYENRSSDSPGCVLRFLTAHRIRAPVLVKFPQGYFHKNTPT